MDENEEYGEETTHILSFSPEIGERASSSGTKSSSSASSLSEEEKSTATSVFAGAKIDGSYAPFIANWAFGMSLTVPLTNLTGKGRTLVAYAASHEAVLYDYIAKNMRLLQGHKNIISSISVDSSGQWLVSGDEGEDNTIIVWDTYECIPVNTIFNPHPGYGISVLAISPNAKYLITIGKEPKPVINFWLWTYGRDKPDDTYTPHFNYGPASKISFNPNANEHIMIAFEKQVKFFKLDTQNNKFVFLATPSTKTMKKFGHITDCTYMNTCHECIASTTEGYIFIYGSTIFVRPFDEVELQNAKIFVNAIKVSRGAINCIQAADNVVVTGDSEGRLKFFDNTMRILYWCQKFTLPSITFISFHLEPRLYKLRDAADPDDDIFDTSGYDEENMKYEDYSEEYEQLYGQLVPTDATVQQLPFIIRDFIIATKDGRIASIDYLHNKCDFFFNKCNAFVTAMDTHDEEPYLCIGYADNTVRLYNYQTHEMVVESQLPEEEYEEQYKEFNPVISYIKYSPQSLHLACSTTNGNLWFLEPIRLVPRFEVPRRATKMRIIKIAFSLDSQFVACADENSTVCAMKYCPKDSNWISVGKIKSHYKPINDILFTPHLPSRLFTIGEDRCLVEYHLDGRSYPELEIRNIERIEQCAIPVSFIYSPRRIAGIKDKYFFMSDNQYKYKSVNDDTFMCHSVALGPAYGCYLGNPVNKMSILPNHDNKYLIFGNKHNIGIQIFPADGNPFKFLGTIGHPTELLDFRLDYEGKYIFTFGKDDNCVLKWDVKVSAAQDVYKLGGTDMEPYYCLIEGGIHGWLFREMQDLFYYMQILHQGENTVVPRTVSDKIPVSELPDLMRACGFYPSEYEIENMLVDVRYRSYEEKGYMKEDVTFLEFVQLYINYRPAHGVSMADFESSFNYACLRGDGPSSNVITRSSFTQLICQRGEYFSLNKARTCLATLMHQDDNDDDDPEDFSFMPENINFRVLLQDILGIDLERQTIEEAENAVNEAEDELIC